MSIQAVDQTLDRLQPFALALLRIAAGLLYMEHGVQKLFGWPVCWRLLVGSRSSLDS